MHLPRYVELAGEQLVLRQKVGDRLDEPRPVDHTIEFRGRRRAAEAAAELTRLGYRVSTSRRRLLGATVEATREDALDLDSVASFLKEVVAVAHRHGGTYDGWGAPVVGGPPSSD